MSSLPPEIITELLTRLPVKSLLRFRCVSKPWCAEIDSQFIKLHLTHSIITGSNLSPIAQYKDTLYFLDSDSLKNLVKIETPFIIPQDSIVYTTCNGLILIEALDNLLKPKVNLILLNPSTRKHVVLPTPPPYNKYVGAVAIQSSYCLGYDVINDDYKVFNILVFLDESYCSIGCDVRVYSLKSNEWHILKGFGKEIVSLDRFLVAYVNGALHTLHSTDHTTIVALDVAKERFNLLPMPDFLDKNLFLTRIHVFDGCLAVLRLCPDNQTDIWVMKEYGVKESWTMFLSVKSENPGPMVIPMVYSKSRTEVLMSYDCRKLVWYDLGKKTVKSFNVSGLPVKFNPLVCVESLVSVGRTGKVDEKKRQHGEEKMKVEIVKNKRDDFLSKGFKLKF